MTSKKWILIFFTLIIMMCVVPGVFALDQYGVWNTSDGMFRDDNLAMGIDHSKPNPYLAVNLEKKLYSEKARQLGIPESEIASGISAFALPPDNQPGSIQENRDSNNPMSLTLTVSSIPLVNEETTLKCEVSSVVDAPETMVTINLPPGSELVGGTLQGTWDIRKDTTVKFSAVVKFTKPGDYRIIATARARPEVDHTWGASNALYLTIGTDKSGYTPPPEYVEQAVRVPAMSATAVSVANIPKISIAALNANVSGVTPLSIDKNGDQNPAFGPASGTVTLHGQWVYNTKVVDGNLSDYRDNEDTIMPLKYALVNIYDYDTGQYLGAGYTNANGEYQISVQNPYPHRIVAYVFSYLKYGVLNYELRVVNSGGTLTGLTDVWALQTDAIVPPSSSGTVEVGTLRPWPGSDSLHAFWLFQDMIKAWEYLPADPKSSTIKWSATQTPADAAIYNFYGQIFLGGLEYTSADTSLHEFGHNYMTNYKGAWDNDCPSPHFFTPVGTVRCAYTEGWANFFALAVNGNPVYTWSSGSIIDLEAPTWGSPGWANGDAVEGRVAGAMWDMMDTAYDGNDVYTWLFSDIDTVMKTNTVFDFSTFWNTWKSNGNSQNAAFSIYQNTIDYGLPTVPAPVISSITPNSVFIGDPDLIITVDGSDFYPTSKVRCNGRDWTTTFVSPTRLNVLVHIGDTTPEGDYSITVFTPAPGGGTSNSIPFTVKGVIHIKSPNGGERWIAGTTNPITWSQSGLNGKNVKIELSKLSDSGFYQLINDSVPAQKGVYTWMIPADLAPDTSYRVKISSQSDPLILDETDGFLEITPPLLFVFSPKKDQIWYRGTEYPITWTHVGLSGTNVKIELWKWLGEPVLERTIVDSVPADARTFTWLVGPDNLEPQTNYWVRITSLSNPASYDSSDGFEIALPQSLKMTSPNGREEWGPGTTHAVTWNQTSLMDTNVDIQLWKYSDPSFLLSIAESVPAQNGTYTWKIPSDLAPGTDYAVRITSLNVPSIYDLSDWYFEITPPPTIKVTSPNSGEKWGLGTTHAFTWNQTGLADTDVKIELMQVNGMFTVVRRTIATSTPAGTGTFDWTIPTDLAPGTDYTVRITSLNVPSVKDSSDSYFEITPTPTVKMTIPNGGESWGAGTIHTVTWTQIGLADTNAKLELWKGEIAISPERIINSSVPAGTGTYSWTIPPDLVPATDYRVRIASLNVPTVKDSSDGFLRITPLPTLHVTSPNGGEKWINSTSHAINWTQTGLTGTPVKIDLYHGPGEFIQFKRTIAASVLAQNNTYTWTIPADLAPDTNYWIKITSLNAPSVYDFSDAGFEITILPSLHITALSFTKSISVDNKTWMDNSVNVTAGSTVYYNLTVKNTGDCTLSSVTVNDAGSITTAQFVDPGITWKQYFRKTAGSVNYTNTATASGTSAYGSTPIITDNASYRIFKPTVMIQPAVTEINLKSTKTVNIVLDETPSGLWGYNLTITPTNPQVTQVLSVTYPAWAASQHTNSTLPGDTFWMKATDDTFKVEYGAKNVLMATLTVRGDVSGTTVFNIQANQIIDDNGNPLSPLIVPGTIKVVPGVIPLPGYTNPPTDPDGDGIYEDLNGNGRLDFADVVLYFNQMEWIAANEPVSAFDLNGNGRIDFADIVKLFGEI